jgi:hypothetical protein
MDAPHRGVRWLGKLMHPPGRIERFTIVLKAYLDASGSNTGEPVAVVAGFVANEKVWEAFEAAWVPFLDDFGLKRFHAAPFWARKERPYVGWDTPKHDKCKEEVCRIISSIPKPMGVGVAVDTRLFEEWRMTLDAWYPSDPYYFCLDRVLYRLITGISEYPEDEGVTIYCDQEQGYEAIGQDIARWHQTRLKRDPTVGTHAVGPDRQVDVHYGSSVDFKPLQLADILAHGVFQWKRDSLKGDPTEPPFIECMKKANYPLGIIDFQTLAHIQIDVSGRFSTTATEVRADRIKWTYPRPSPSSSEGQYS